MFRSECSAPRLSYFVVALELSEADAEWYRYYGANRRGPKHRQVRMYRYANPIPERGRNGKKWRLPCVDRMEWRSWVSDDGPFKDLWNFAAAPLNP